ncbi:Laccase-3 [Acorus calamus]|uniref:laccase n=1 Tax=Acorus calamus TaxID=4465 RepID=A0AAV9C3N2_ACOCL|nr:Laccase-3 [Acorus calamus]
MNSQQYCLLLCLLFFAQASAEIHYHDFVVRATPVNTHTIITVNGQFPGPTIEVRNGDTLVVNVADGPEFVTQCPINPGGNYTYRFTIEGQKGTLWWHAHSSWLRATVYGALIIYPKPGSSYPFPKPKREAPIILGEWWNANPIDVVNEATRTGTAPNNSDAYTINGQPGDLYNCSSQDTVIIPVNPGETNLYRVINTAMNNELFVSIAGHRMTVVATDASYTKPFTTPVLMLGPGQTTDILFTGCSAQPGGSTGQPMLPLLPAFNDTFAATAFAAGIRSLTQVQLPDPVDEDLFFTVGLGLLDCEMGRTCGGPNGTRFAASMNNASFVFPSTLSILQAYRSGMSDVFTDDIPRAPPVQFDYTGANVPRELWQPMQGSKGLKLKYGFFAHIVLQGTNIVVGENHPIHLHGHDFYILAEGFGNFDPATDKARFNMVDPSLRNIVAVPVNGWAVIRFKADNPGVWLMHCHLDVHITWGLAMVLIVEDGVEELETLEPPTS